MKNKQIKPLSFPFYSIPCLLFALIGLTSSIYLLIVHYKNYTDPAFSSICAISRAMNCDTVAQSTYSILFNVPLALWGIVGFLCYLYVILLSQPKTNRQLWALIFYLGLFSSLISLYFGYISAIEIHSYCIFCIVCYLCHLLITFYAFIIHQRFNLSYSISATVKGMKILSATYFLKAVITIIFLNVIALPFSLPHYWELSSNMHLSPEISRGLTDEGNPWIGADQPELTVSIFSDYQCFQCYKMHFLFLNLVARFPEKIRLVHIHFPLDHKYNPAASPQPYHVGAGKLALLAIEAAAEGRFWQTSDELFAIGRAKGELDINNLAEKCNLDRRRMSLAISNQRNIIQLRRDMKKGIELTVNSTPSFLINNKIYRGTIPLTIFQQYSLDGLEKR